VTLAAGLLTSALAAPARAAVPALAESPSPTAAALAGEAARAGVSAKLLAAVAGLALVCGGVAFGLGSDCSDAPQPPTRAAAPPAVVAAAPTLAPAPAELKTWVTLSGRVAFPKGRDLPKVRIVPEGQVKDKDALNPFMPLRHEDLLIDPETRGIANAVVFLRPDADDRKAEFPKDKVHPALAKPEPVDRAVSVAGGQFAPRVLVARAGDRVTFTNLLTVPTNVLYRPLADAGDGREFNVLVLKDTSYTSKPLPALSFADCYSSTIHLWMKGYVWAFDHPYFAVTDASGRFEMPKVPAGTWRLVVWQEAVGWLGGVPGKFGRKVTVPATRTGTHELDLLTFDSDRWPE
jgi:hypothetical protein